MVPVLDNVSFCLRRRIRYSAKFDLASSATDTVFTLKFKTLFICYRACQLLCYLQVRKNNDLGIPAAAAEKYIHVQGFAKH